MKFDINLVFLLNFEKKRKKKKLINAYNVSLHKLYIYINYINLY